MSQIVRFITIKEEIKLEIKIKCPKCRTGYYQYCSSNPPIYVCSNYGAGCNKGISKEEYEKLAKQIMPKMSLFEIQQTIYDIMREKQNRINEFKKELNNKKINFETGIGWMFEFGREIIEKIE
jgi:hypothetical protein